MNLLAEVADRFTKNQDSFSGLSHLDIVRKTILSTGDYNMYLEPIMQYPVI